MFILRIEKVKREHLCKKCSNVLFTGDERIKIGVGRNYCIECGYKICVEYKNNIDNFTKELKREYGRRLVLSRLK